MTFLAPTWLLLFLPALALGAAYLVAQRRRRRFAVRFASLPMLQSVAPRRPGWRRHAPAVAFALALSGLALAAARPEVDVRVPHERATVILAIDVSRSMEATDVEPNRIESAQAAAREFVAGLPETFNVGIVAFAGAPSVLVEPTTDRDALDAALDDLSLAPSTAIGEAVFTSLQEIARMAEQAPPGEAGGGAAAGPDQPAGAPDAGSQDAGGQSAEAEAEPVPGRIALLSDGTNTQGRSPSEAAEAARAAGVPVSTIAYGTPSGTIESDGVTTPVPADTATLAQLAESTNGQAYTAESGTELSAVYEDIGTSIGWRTEPREITPYLLGAAFLLLTAAGVMSLLWFARLP